jgi:predicted negative regulator of RcsB-dependent stress response
MLNNIWTVIVGFFVALLALLGISEFRRKQAQVALEESEYERKKDTIRHDVDATDVDKLVDDYNAERHSKKLPERR